VLWPIQHSTSLDNDHEQRVMGREKPSLPHAHLIGHEQPDENYHA
jgi:hypothetical protein